MANDKEVKVKKLRNEDRIENLEKNIASISEAVGSLIKMQEEAKLVTVPDQLPIDSPLEVSAPGTITSSFVPSKFRQIVDEVLSPEFGIRMDDFSDRMEFAVTIIVPPEYSNLPSEHKRMGVIDERTRVISRAMGELGVREWAMKVRENLAKHFRNSGTVSPFKSTT